MAVIGCVVVQEDETSTPTYLERISTCITVHNIIVEVDGVTSYIPLSQGTPSSETGIAMPIIQISGVNYYPKSGYVDDDDYEDPEL